MEETFFTILGTFMIYTWIHFFVITFDKVYAKRSGYEKFLTWFAVVSNALVIIGLVS